MILSHMLEISHTVVPKEATGGPYGQLGALGARREGPMVGDLLKPKMTYLSQKNIVLQYKMLKITMKASG